MSDQPLPVPDDLMNQLHEATAHFHDCRVQLEAEFEGVEYGHQERLDSAAQKLREAEVRIEEIEKKIKEAMQ